MTTSATLVYRTTPHGNAAAVQAALAAVPLPEDVLSILGLTVTSDATVDGVRTIVLAFTPTFLSYFPNVTAQTLILRNLLTTGLQKAALAQVRADQPVLT
jgi:hypothetical protein